MSGYAVPSSSLPTGVVPRGLEPIDDEVLDIFGPAPLLPGENRDAYTALFYRIRSAVAPTDLVEEVWAFDVTNLVWESLRLRRLRAKLLASCAGEGLRQLLSSLVGPEDDLDNLIYDWVERIAGAVARVDELLGRAGYDQETIMARTLAARLDDVGRIEQMIAGVESRRNAILREVDRRRRDAFARRLREASLDAEDAKFEDITIAAPKREAA